MTVATKLPKGKYRDGNRSYRIKSNGRAHVEMGVAMTNVLVGNEDLSTWDVEELRRGRKRDKNGRFQGRPPTVLPRNMFIELGNRLFGEAQQKLLDMLLPALDQLESLAMGASLDKEDAIRLKAIQEIMNRILGKPEQTVHISGETHPFQRVERTTINRDLGDYDKDESPVLEARYTED